MNIFVLHKDPIFCARMHCDKHVVKMILESAQMLSTIANQNGLQGPYKSTHKNHPCTLWAGKTLDNYLWLYHLMESLNKEFKHRYSGKDHASWLKIYESDIVYEIDLPLIGLTEFAQAMPEKYKDPDPVKAYRAYYIGEKKNFAKWTKREIPDWFKNGQ
jgi:hypothetical protein